jgi:hypothetical protein
VEGDPGGLAEFDPQGRFFYLDTSMGKPVQHKFRLRGRELTILFGDGGDWPQVIRTIDKTGIHFTKGKPWQRIACKRFDEHIRK